MRHWRTLSSAALITGTLLAAGCAPADRTLRTAAVAPASIAAPLIPRDALFGNPQRSAAQISPDGRHVSWLAPVDGVMNVYVAPAGSPEAARAVTRERQRNLRFYQWAPDSAHILYTQDVGGNENFQVHAVDIAGGQDRNLTPVAARVRADIVAVSPLRPDVVAVAMNERNPQLFDLYEINYRTGARKLVAENPAYASMIVDAQLRPRFGVQLKDGKEEVFRRTASGAWEHAFTIPVDDVQATNPIGFNKAGTAVYWLDSRGRDKAALVRMDPDTGQSQVVAGSEQADVSSVLRDPRTWEPAAYAVNYLRQDWTAIDPAMRGELELLRTSLKGDIDIVSVSDDGSRAIVVAAAAESPATYYLYDRAARNLRLLFQTRPDLADFPLQPMHPVAIPSRDRRTLVSYLTLPPGSDANGDGVPERPVPLVLSVHGGPWSRDAYGFNSVHQWLANRGYAVMSVNYRGSTGFGKEFVNIAAGEWAGKMHDDLIDAVDWAVERGVTSRDKVAIMGGSYGGYATLVGLTFTPDRFRCGVDIVGPSNLVTLIESFPPYWAQSLTPLFTRHIGDPKTPEGRRLALERSPISRVDRIRVPLLIGQGQNDPRVVKAESDQIVAAMRQRNLPVTYINYPDEGHGFVRPPNNISFRAVTEAFLQPCLGGRAEPIGDDFTGSTIQVLEGAQHVPGLAQAWQRHSPGGTN
jgi:dipeptidyl aminopeptidase/acylaminoacyl peptidase